MGWSIISFVFQKLAEVLTDHVRDPESSIPILTDPSATIVTILGLNAFKQCRRRRRRLTRARLLSFVDDFAMFEGTYDKTALALANCAFALMTSWGLKRHPTKGYVLPNSVGGHLGMTLDIEKGEFRAPTAKLKSIASLAKTLLCRSATHKRWVMSVKDISSLAGKEHFLYLVILVFNNKIIVSNKM
jgi:hypothetical protein